MLGDGGQFVHQGLEDSIELGMPSTWESRSLAISDTWDFDSPVMPKVSTSFSILRVLTPSR
jgi:hypothetical protein